MKDCMKNNTPIKYIENFIENDGELFNKLWKELAWERRGEIPRREYYCNEISVPYTYGVKEFARTYEPKVWHEAILEIKNKVEKELGIQLEVCFLNGYENSKDQLNWHSDDSPEMDDSRPIVIVTLGATREIWFRKIPKNGEKIPMENVDKLMLKSGSMCIMLPGMQDTHQHRIPKSGYECGPRISLTFRGYVNSD